MALCLSLRIRIAAGLLCAISASPLSANERHLYRETRGAESSEYVWTMDADESAVRITFAETHQTFVNRCQPSGANFEWSVKSEQREIRAHRSGNEIVLSGHSGGAPLSRRVVIDDDPWYQPLSYSLRQFVHSGAPSVRFWLLRPDTLDAFKLKAERAGRERIAANGVSTLAEKVRISTTGLLTGLWEAH